MAGDAADLAARRDGKAYIVEEVARIYGYDRIPAVSLPRASAVTAC